MLSDRCVTAGPTSIRWALLTLAVFCPIVAFHYWRAGRMLCADLKRSGFAGA